MGAPRQPTSLSRAPVAELRPFVRLVWASLAKADRKRGSSGAQAFEHVLPTGAMHLVVRPGNASLRLIEPDLVLNGSVIGGARSTAYCKDLSCAADSVGAMIEPGACAALLGMPGIEASETHLSLASVWGDADERRLSERIEECRTLEGKLALFETELLVRVRRALEVHPMIVQSVRALAATPETSIADLVAQSGYSHRVFALRFREATGLGPKTYARVLRFQRAVAGVSGSDGGNDARLALELGYADQAHFCREFREMSGLRPAEYRAATKDSPNHVPVPRGGPVPRRDGQIRSIEAPRVAASSARIEPSRPTEKLNE